MVCGPATWGTAESPPAAPCEAGTTEARVTTSSTCTRTSAREEAIVIEPGDIWTSQGNHEWLGGGRASLWQCRRTLRARLPRVLYDSQQGRRGDPKCVSCPASHPVHGGRRGLGINRGIGPRRRFRYGRPQSGSGGDHTTVADANEQPPHRVEVREAISGHSGSVRGPARVRLLAHSDTTPRVSASVWCGNDGS